jgi:hypothetical protein
MKEENNMVITLTLSLRDDRNEAANATLLIQRGELTHLRQFATCVMGRHIFRRV